MAKVVVRTKQARISAHPDLFLSHSSRDKNFVRKLAEDLTFCEVDVWLDEWEIGPGDSLHDMIGEALEQSRFVGVVLGENFADSRWARDELKQAFSREKRSNDTIVLPLLSGDCEIPAFLEDKVFLDFRDKYYIALFRLAGLIHGVSRLRVEEAIRERNPVSVGDVVRALRYCGIEPYMVLGEDDFKEISGLEGVIRKADRVRFNPVKVREAKVSPRIKNLMTKLLDIWLADKEAERVGPGDHLPD
jgi:hypothetical protein